MGEKVWYKRLRVGTERKNKAETEWHTGIWLGPAALSSETLVGTAAGVVRASAIKRFEEAGKWDVEAIMEMKGTPQRPNPNKPGLHIPIQIRMEPEVPIDMSGMANDKEGEVPRRTYLKKYHFEKHGCTAQCDGCSRLDAGMAARPHNEECRKRMYEAMRKTEEGRQWMGKADDEINEYMEEKVKEREEREKENAASQEGSPEETKEPATEASTEDASPCATDGGDAAREQKKESRPRSEEDDAKQKE